MLLAVKTILFQLHSITIYKYHIYSYISCLHRYEGHIFHNHTIKESCYVASTALLPALQVSTSNLLEFKGGNHIALVEKSFSHKNTMIG